MLAQVARTARIASDPPSGGGCECFAPSLRSSCELGAALPSRRVRSITETPRDCAAAARTPPESGAGAEPAQGGAARLSRRPLLGELAAALAARPAQVLPSCPCAFRDTEPAGTLGCWDAEARLRGGGKAGQCFMR